MSTSTRHRFARSVAAVGVIALGAVGLFSATAHAAPVSDFGNIDPAKRGSIIINKHQEMNNAPVKPDGTQNITSPGIGDVEFTVYRVNGLDLTTASGWDLLKNAQASSNCSVPGYTIFEVGKVTTDAAGKATVPNLPVAAYLVCETKAPNTVVKKAAPFIVSIPLPFEQGWLYDVNVYPKNSLGGIEKEVVTPTNSELGLGSKVKFPVHTSIPTIAASENLTSFIVRDTLDSRLTPVTVESVKVGGVDVDPSYYTTSIVGQTAKVTFTSAGLAWLKTPGGKKVDTVFAGVVASIGNGTIENQAVAFINDPAETNGKELVSNKVVTKWGDLRVLKTDSKTPATVLAGAEFELYEAVTPYPAAAGDCSTAQPTGSAITVKGKSKFVSDSTGLVYIDGAFVSDTNTGEQAFRCYVLKETKAPAGYVTPVDPKNLTGVAVTAGATATGTWDATVKNQQQPAVELPLTGSTGQLALWATGAGLLALSVALFAVRRRKQAEDSVDA